MRMGRPDEGLHGQRDVAEPAAFERANYMKALNSLDPLLAQPVGDGQDTSRPFLRSSQLRCQSRNERRRRMRDWLLKLAAR
jgi:hypothetical protein